ncbi:MAG: FHA domain-containing protein [Anaerolineales bacterium]|nr:FHA domain-containing protein [Anaerolineales bacterium]
MITCPNCKNQEVPGAIFCSECGTQLIEGASARTHEISTAEGKQIKTSDTTVFPKPPPMAPDSWISLHMVDSGQILTLTERSEFTLGRVAEGQPIMPDIDLTPYNAYAQGVSRLHAVIKLVHEKIIVMDLGSSNGTYVNGNHLAPYVESPLTHGDVLYLGKLKVQVLFGEKQTEKG